MRDTKRINVLCDKLKELWYLDPDLRFPQIFYVLLDEVDNKGCSGDGFYTEDDKWLEAIVRLIENYGNRRNK